LSWPGSAPPHFAWPCRLWPRSPEAAPLKEIRGDVTGLGLAAHVAAAFFWAATWVAMRILRSKGVASFLLLAAGVALMAAILAYLILPRSMSPGWHLVLGPAGEASGFAALGAGLFLGASLARTRG
jgi:drug/metabolite transporter (DMT)-like permease